MNYSQYAAVAPKTLKKLETPEADWFHMQLGLITEVGELCDTLKKFLIGGKPFDFVNVVEEVGDCTWYLIQLWTMAGLHPVDLEAFMEDLTDEDVASVDAKELARSMAAVCGLIANLEPSDIPGEIDENPLAGMFVALATACRAWGQKDLPAAFDMNIAKLHVKRYNKGFTENALLFRDLPGERAVLEAVYAGTFDVSPLTV